MPKCLMFKTALKKANKQQIRVVEVVFHCCSFISFVFKVCLLSAAALSRPA